MNMLCNYWKRFIAIKTYVSVQKFNELETVVKQISEFLKLTTLNSHKRETRAVRNKAETEKRNFTSTPKDDYKKFLKIQAKQEHRKCT